MLTPLWSRLTSHAAVRRPAVLAVTTALVLTGLLGTGLLVAGALEGEPVSDTGTATTAEPAPTASAAGESTGSGTTTSGGDDNVAVAVNTKDGSTVYAVRLKVVVTGADTVDSGNAAVAVASCSDCQTVAIALEGVVVTGDAEVVAPENIALAINSGCSNCQTLAYAYQNLQTVDGKVRLTGAGRAGIARLRQQLNALRTSGLDILAVKAEVDRIAGEFAAILGSEVVPIGQPTTSASPSADPSAEPSTSAPTSAAETATTSPGPVEPSSTGSPAPAAGEPTGSPTPTSGPQDTPTPEPTPTG